MRLVSALSIILAASFVPASAIDEQTAKAKGANAAAALVQKLGGEVKSQMQTGGPVGALNFCSQNALNLTQQVARDTGTKIQRISLKNRNPVNAGTSEEKAVLDKWSAAVQNGQPLPEFELKKLENGEYVFYKPIVINNEACLKCHGDVSADSPLGQAIKTAYPNDKATGYKMGDLRGMISVKISE